MRCSLDVPLGHLANLSENKIFVDFFILLSSYFPPTHDQIQQFPLIDESIKSQGFLNFFYFRLILSKKYKLGNLS